MRIIDFNIFIEEINNYGTEIRERDLNHHVVKPYFKLDKTILIVLHFLSSFHISDPASILWFT